MHFEYRKVIDMFEYHKSSHLYDIKLTANCDKALSKLWRIWLTSEETDRSHFTLV